MHAFLLLRIAEQVEAERVGWWEDVIEEVHSSFQMVRLNQALQEPHTICAEMFKTRNKNTQVLNWLGFNMKSSTEVRKGGNVYKPMSHSCHG